MPSQAFATYKQAQLDISTRSATQCIMSMQQNCMISLRIKSDHLRVYGLLTRPGSNACDSLIHPDDSSVMSDEFLSTALSFT